jgi:hypothetical protein
MTTLVVPAQLRIGQMPMFLALPDGPPPAE